MVGSEKTGTKTNTENATFFKMLFKDNTTVMLIVDKSSFRVMEVNQAAQSYFAMDGAKIAAEGTFLDLFAETDRPELTRLVRKATFSEKDRETVWQTIPLNNNSHFVEIQWGEIIFQGEQAFLVSLFDVTRHVGSQDEFANFFQLALDLLFMTDLKGNFLEINQTWEKTFGYSRKHFEAACLFDLLIPEDVAPARAALDQLLKRKTMPILTSCFLTVTGEKRHIEWQACINHKTFYGIARDITKSENELIKLHGAMDSLNKSNRMLQAILDVTPVNLFWKDIRLTYQGANKVFLKDAGFEQVDDLIGLTDFDMPWSQHAPLFQQGDQEIIKTGISKINIEEKLISDDGQVRWIKTSKMPLRDESGQITGIFGTFEDISKSRETEAALIEEEEFLRNLLHLLDSALTIDDNDGLLKFVSRELARLYDADICVVALWDITDKRSVPLYFNNNRVKERNSAPEPEDLCFADYVMEKGHVITVENLAGSPYANSYSAIKLTNNGSLLGIPIIVNEQKFGTVIIGYNQLRDFSPANIERGNITSSILSLIIARNQSLSNLNKSEELMRSFIEEAPLGIMVADGEGHYLQANEAASAMLGYTRDELLNMQISDISSPSQPNESRLHFINLKEKGRSSGDLILMRKDHSEFWCSISGAKIHEDLYIAYFKDVTERLESQAKLGHEKTLLSGLLNSIPDIIFYKDLDGKYLGGNQAFEKLLGVKLDKVIGLTNHELFNAELAQKHDRRTHELFKKSRPQIFEEDLHYPDGTIVPTETMYAPFYSLEGNIIGMLGLCRDISDRKRIENILLDKYKQIRNITANVPGMIAQVIMKPDQTITIPFSNMGSLALYGYTPEEIKHDALKVMDRIHPDDKDRFLRSVFSSKEHLTIWSEEFRVILPEKGEIWVKGNGKPEPLPDGSVLWNSYLMDITLLKQLETELKQSEARFRSVYQNAAIGLYRTTPKGEFVMANPTLVRILDYDSIEDLQKINLNDESVTSSFERDEFLKTILEKGEIIGFETSWKRKNGDDIYVRENAIAVYDQKGMVQYFDGSVEDITQEKQMTDALRISEQKFRQLAENIDAIVWLHSAGSKQLLYVNPAYEKITGLPLQSAYENSDNFFSIVLKEDAATLSQQFQSYLQHNTPLNTEYRIRRKDGKIRWLKVRSSKLLDEKNKTNVHVGLTSDITELKEAEISLKETLKLEKTLGELKTRYLSMASHEFRNPLATIQATAETLQTYRKKMTEDQLNKRIEKILSQVGHLKNMMSDVLDLAKIMRGTNRFTPAQNDFVSLLNEIAEDHRSHPKFNHSLQVDVEEKKLLCQFDKNLMQQILSNLLVNAMVYSDAGTEIKLSSHVLSGEIVVNITDQGIGIPKNDLDKLFEPFSRGSNVSGIPGTGLGMFIIKEGIELHGGTIRVQSTVGKGTNVCFKIPIKKSDI